MSESELRNAIEERAKELGLFVNPYAEAKIKWSEENSHACQCDRSRICPCDQIGKDLTKYNGQCLCGVFVTEEKLSLINKNKTRVKEKRVISPEEKEKQKKREKEAWELAKTLGCKNCL